MNSPRTLKILGILLYELLKGKKEKLGRYTSWVFNSPRKSGKAFPSINIPQQNFRCLFISPTRSSGSWQILPFVTLTTFKNMLCVRQMNPSIGVILAHINIIHSSETSGRHQINKHHLQKSIMHCLLSFYEKLPPLHICIGLSLV